MPLLGIAFPVAACVLLLWAQEAMQTLGFGILPLHDFNCSQLGVECTAEEVNVPPISWFESMNWTPMPPQRMNVTLALVAESTCPIHQAVLNITWQVDTDASILHLEGAEVCVLRHQGSHSLCVRYAFSRFSSSHNPSGRPWEFYFDRFEAEPSMHYTVYIYSLPMAMSGQDDLHISAEIYMPDCRNRNMMLTSNCVKTGSLWQPRVQMSLCENKLVVNFNTSSIYSEKYHVIVQPDQGSQCGNRQRLEQRINETKDQRSTLSDIDKGLHDCLIFMEAKVERKSVIFDIHKGLQECNLSVEIIPFFEACKNDCTRKLVNVTKCCSRGPEELSTTSPCTVPFEVKGIVLTGVAVLLLCLLLIAVIVWRKKVASNLPKSNFPRIPLGPDEDKSPRHKVLLLYSMDHNLYKNVICSLASYLQGFCGFEVILDQLETKNIAQMGNMNWLQARKTEMEGPGNMIMVVCSRGVMVKWRRAMFKEGGEASSRENDCLIGDMFTPALGLIANDFKNPNAARNKYIVTYFEEFSSEDDVPEILRMALQYKLMTNMRDVYFRICGKEQCGPGVVCRANGISEDDYHTSTTGKHLYEAINKFKMFQKSNPTWFEKLDDIPSESMVHIRDEVERDGAMQHCLHANLPELGYESKIDLALSRDIMQSHLVKPSLPDNTSASPALAQSDRFSRPFVDQWPAFRGHQNNYSAWEQQHILASNVQSSLDARPRSEGYHSSGSENGRCSTPLTLDSSHDGRAIEPAQLRNDLQEFDENAALVDNTGRKVGSPSVDNKDSGIDGLSADVESCNAPGSMMKLLYEFQKINLSEHLKDLRIPGTTSVPGVHVGPAMTDKMAQETML
uniref:IL-17RA.3 n=1 Tax=Lampetra planeri TaxID=7750 RepID=A0A0P0HPD3_LAMPL|nr:IL-17RA.3 [Lampetra planeri]